MDGSAGILDHCIVRYGGAYEDANIVCSGNASPTISNSEISYSDVDGIRLHNNAHPTISNCMFSNNPHWPIQRWDQATPRLSGNTFTDNGHDAIYVNGHTIPEGAEVQWDNPGVPYVIGGTVIAAGGTLNIAAGTVVKLRDNDWLRVYGTLNAVGTASNKIVFTAYTDDYYGGDTNSDGLASIPVGDYWNSLHFSGGSRDTLDYCIIKYGGYSNDANIVFDGDASRATVTHSIITYSDGAGIRCKANAQPTVVHCLLSPNEDSGIKVDGTFDVDVTNNWWGDSTGPYHPTTHPSGLGITVTDHVLFDPWLDTAPVEEPEPTVVEEPTGPVSSTISLMPGLNMISLPLKPARPYTAQSLLAKVGGTMVIAMEEGRFITYLSAFGGAGFSIEGGKGYIVNVP